MISQPVGQKRLTNVAVVRLKKAGKRFEIACYRNKVLEWRNKIEKDIDEVLQTHKVFVNVSKGQLAKRDELQKSFGHDDEQKICLEILSKGELQVSDKERGNEYENLFHEIATKVAELCVDPNTQRPLTVGIVERTMKDIHYAVNPQRNAKQQALDVVRQLQQKIPIERAQMRLKVSGPAEHAATLHAKLSALSTRLIAQDSSSDRFAMTMQIDPGKFRAVDEAVRSAEGATVEVLNLAVHQEGDETFL